MKEQTEKLDEKVTTEEQVDIKFSELELSQMLVDVLGPRRS